LLSGRIPKIFFVFLAICVFLAGAFLASRRKPAPVYPTIRITVPEGYTVARVDELLSEKKVIAPGALLGFDSSSLDKEYCFLEKGDGLEGFLFPDTYEFFLGSSAKVVTEKFLDNFNRRAAGLVCGKEAPGEIVIMASLIEKEIPDFESDRNIVSGILWKRMEFGMPLQVDASLCFASNPLGCGDSGIDLKMDSLYNTYLYYGLPPGPIANPGLSAIIAALNPEESPYWYYISDPKTKKTVFSKSLDEHNRNIVKYLKGNS